MAKIGDKVKVGRSSASGKFTDVRKVRPTKALAGSALTQTMVKRDTKSGQVLKTVSSAHSEALKRLKDR